MVDYNKLTLFHGMTERMRYLSERQNVIAQNIANANTPGYIAKDLKPVDFANVLASHESKIDLAVTNKAHIRPALESDFKTVRKKKSFETTINGNNVVLEEQMQKMSETSGSFQETTALYKKMTDIVRLATGANR
jgi:flagellar basal-body rod protein FlgB